MKVISIEYHHKTEQEQKDNPYWTGLTIELEDGTKLQQNTTDVVEPFSKIK